MEGPTGTEKIVLSSVRMNVSLACFVCVLLTNSVLSPSLSLHFFRVCVGHRRLLRRGRRLGGVGLVDPKARCVHSSRLQPSVYMLVNTYRLLMYICV